MDTSKPLGLAGTKNPVSRGKAGLMKHVYAHIASRTVLFGLLPYWFARLAYTWVMRLACVPVPGA